MDGLLQGSPQVHSPLLDHLADVLYPVLLVLNTGRLCRRESHQEAVPFLPVPSTCRSPLLPNFPVSKELLTEKQTQLSLIDNQADDSNFMYFH